MTNFQTVFAEIKANVSKNKTSGAPIRSFSRSEFDKLAKAYVNDPNYQIPHATLQDGKMVEKPIDGPKRFRGMIRHVLVDFGVDKAEAERIMEGYDFRNVDGVYELASEVVYKYVEADKKFDFITRPDFQGSLSLRDVPESVKVNRSPVDKDGKFTEKKVKRSAHKQLVRKSGAPKWLNTNLD